MDGAVFNVGGFCKFSQQLEVLWYLEKNQSVNGNGIKERPPSRGANRIPYITGCWLSIVTSDFFRTSGAWIIFCDHDGLHRNDSFLFPCYDETSLFE